MMYNKMGAVIFIFFANFFKRYFWGLFAFIQSGQQKRHRKHGEREYGGHAPNSADSGNQSWDQCVEDNGLYIQATAVPTELNWHPYL